MTTISPVVTELDWNRLVMIKPIIIAIRISSVMESNERTSGSSCRGATTDEIRLRL